MKRRIKIYLAAAVLGTMMLGSCNAPKNVTYFQDTENLKIWETAQETPITVRPGDRLSIIVKSKDPAVSDLFNLPVYSNRLGSQLPSTGNSATLRMYSGPTGEGISFYTVTREGTIDFPVLGELKIEGMTRAELAGFIKGELMAKNLVKDPTITVDFLNVGVNVMGEVVRPGRYDLNTDRITVLDALTLAGDLKITGQRENVRVLREENGKVTSYIIDLTDAEGLTKSPAYYLQQNDVVYVEPNKMEKRNTTVNGNNALSVSFWVSLASLLTSVVTTLGVFIRK